MEEAWACYPRFNDESGVNSDHHQKVGIAGIEYALPECRMTLRDLHEAGRLDSAAERLAEFGFGTIHVSNTPAETLAREAIDKLVRRSNLDAESVDAVFYAGAIPASHAVGGTNGEFLTGFNYPVARLQYEFGLRKAVTVGISQAGCMGLMSAVKCASDFLLANPEARQALCVSADVFPTNAKREIIYNVISDGACALLVEKDASLNRIVAQRQITKGYYWDSTEKKNELVASYFPTAKHIVKETLAAAAIGLGDVACIIPHNVSLRSWEILLGLLGLPREKLFTDNIATKGHVIAADNFINLKDAADAGKLRRGDKLLLFNFGFGANWGCLVLEH
jgi:3-oxoacyl-[acyl-carrier-protein] synthase-3